MLVAARPTLVHHLFLSETGAHPCTNLYQPNPRSQLAETSLEAAGLKFELCWSGTSCSRQGPDATQCLEHPWFSGYSEVGGLWKILNCGVSEWKVQLSQA